MMKILLATHNPHKKEELQVLLASLQVDIVTLDELNDHDEVDETGITFFDNAYLKASYFAKKHQLTTLADDSGLVIPSLDGKPGIYSARYSGLGDYENNLKVLREMAHKTDRIAYFVSSLVLMDPSGKYQAFEGRVYGTIMHEMKGSNGFGYDVIFYYPPFKKGFAELSMTEKNKISHRAKAYHMLKEALS